MIFGRCWSPPIQRVKDFASQTVEAHHVYHVCSFIELQFSFHTLDGYKICLSDIGISLTSCSSQQPSQIYCSLVVSGKRWKEFAGIWKQKDTKQSPLPVPILSQIDASHIDANVILCMLCLMYGHMHVYIC